MRVYKYFPLHHAKRHQRLCHFNPYDYNPITLSEHGEIQFIDIRNNRFLPLDQPPSVLNVVSWNIEMGYRLEAVISELVRIAPDILLLQEADLFDNGRNYASHTVAAIANALGFTAVFAGHQKYKSPSGRGIWGNAILTRFGISNAHFLTIECNEVYNRSALFAEVETGSGPIDFCSVHLEACCGIEKRVDQLTSVIKHIERRQKNNIKPAVIAGDLNTMGNGLVRLSPVHCTDRLRFKTLGMTEAEWWESNYFANSGFSDPFSKRKDITFKNLFIAAKLDWILLKGLCVETKNIGKGNQSDHKWISCTLAK